MFGFGYGFWNQFQNSQIDELLSNEDYQQVDINLILDDEGVIQELRNENSKLNTYFTPSKISVLIDYITQMPQQYSDRKRAYKFPYVACELLCCDNNCILDAFFNLNEVVQELEKQRQSAISEQKQDKVLLLLQEEEKTKYEQESQKKQDKAFEEEVQEKDQNKIEEECEEQNQNKIEEEPQKKDQNNVEEECEEKQVEEQEQNNENEPQNEQNKLIEENEIQNKEQIEQQQQIEQQNENIIKTEQNPQETLQINPVKPEEIQNFNDYTSDMKEDFMLNKLFMFLESEFVQEYTLVGYFSRVVLSLISKRYSITIKYIFGNDKLVKLLIENLEQKSFQELIIKLLTPELLEIQSYLDQRIKMVVQIIQLLKVEDNIELQTNASLIIQEIIEKYSQFNQGNEIFKQILSQDICSKFFEFLINEEKLNQCVNFNNYIENIGVIVQMILTEILQKEQDSKNNSNNQDDQQNCEGFQFDCFLNLLERNIKNLISIMNCDFNQNSIKNQLNQSNVPFGIGKLKILEILGLSLKLNKNKITQQLIEENFFPTIMELFIKYEWNTFLHQQVEKILNYVFSSSSSFELKEYVIKEAKIVNFFVNASSQISISAPNHNSIRKGYMGQLTNIANNLKNCISKEIELQSLVEDQEEWFEFEESFLNQANYENNYDIGGLNQKKMENEIFEDTIEFDKELIPQKYEMFLKQKKEDEQQQSIGEKLDSYVQQLNYNDENSESLSNAIQNYLDQSEDKDKEIEQENNIEVENLEEEQNNNVQQDQEIEKQKEEIANNDKEKTLNNNFYSNSYWIQTNNYIDKIDELIQEL